MNLSAGIGAVKGRRHDAGVRPGLEDGIDQGLLGGTVGGGEVG